MDIFDFRTVDSLPLLYRPESNLLIIGDLHLGLERSVTSEGGYVPQFQLEDLIDDLENAREATGADRILINGDLKHEFATTRYSEKKEIREFLESLDENFSEIIVVKGNHDTFLEDLVEEVGEFKKFHEEDGVLYIHGHAKIEAVAPGADYHTVVMGHEHPALVLRDEIGVKEKVDCFLYGETGEGKNIVVLPAFSRISGGSKVNQVPQEELLSPVLRNSVNVSKLRAVAVSRDAGLFQFPEIGKV